MQLELELLCDFEEHCAHAVGKVLAPNTIGIADERPVRAVILQYELEDVDHEQRH